MDVESLEAHHERAGLVWMWRRGDDLPTLPTLREFEIDAVAEAADVAEATELPLEEVRKLRQAGHSPYLARWCAQVVGYGWSATKSSEFGVPPHAFTIPPGVRYLRKFVTFAEWRGQGVYPYLLQAIMTEDAGAGDQFYILHEWANQSSACGIAKAGFNVIGEVCFLRSGLGLIPRGPADRAESGAALLGLPLVQEAVL